MSKKDKLDIQSLLEKNDPERAALFEVLFGQEGEPSGEVLSTLEAEVLDSVSPSRAVKSGFIPDLFADFQNGKQASYEPEKDPLDQVKQVLRSKTNGDTLPLTEKAYRYEDCVSLPPMEEFGARRRPPFMREVTRSTDHAIAFAEEASIYVSAESGCTGHHERATAGLGFLITPRYYMAGDLHIRAHLVGRVDQAISDYQHPAGFTSKAWIELQVYKLSGKSPLVLPIRGAKERKEFYGVIRGVNSKKDVPGSIELSFNPMSADFNHGDRPQLAIWVSAHVEARAPYSDCSDVLKDLSHCLDEPQFCEGMRLDEVLKTASAEINLAICGVDVMYAPRKVSNFDDSLAQEIERIRETLESGGQRLAGLVPTE